MLDGGGKFLYEVERILGVSVAMGDGSSVGWVKGWIEGEMG